jgi:Mg-chelatase subunit ChlD
MSHRSLLTLWAAASTIFSATLAHADRSVLMVLDASGSMTQKLADGQSRFEAAKAAVGDALAKTADSQRVGLRVYGHQSATSARNCEDTSLVTPMGTAGTTRAAIVNAMKPLSAQGYTPITLSLEKSAGDLMAETATEKVIVLVSDGRETCKGDPCATAKAMAAADASLVIHTIGFGVDAAARMQLQCIANVARGKYFDANSGKSLGDSLGQATQQAAAPPPPPAQKKDAAPLLGKIQIPKLDGPGAEPQIIDPVTGQSVDSTGRMYSGGAEIKPGIYNLKMTNGLWRGVEVKPGATTVLQAGFLVFKGGNKTHRDSFKVYDTETGEEVGDFIIFAFDRHGMIPGRYHIEVEGMGMFKDVEFKPGEVTVLDVAHVKLEDTKYGGKSNSYRLSTEDGAFSRSVNDVVPFTLPPGRYTIQDTSTDGRDPISIEVKGGPNKVTYP